MKLLALIAVVGLCTGLGPLGCGDSGDSTTADADTPADAIPSSAPQIEVPKGPPPAKLVVKDIEIGTGREAKKGDEVALQYIGVDWRDGNEHANSWRYGGTPTFTLGDRRLLRGLNLAVPGMKEGGSREVLIPYTLVYYPNTNHVRLSAEDALVYRVYLEDVLSKGHQASE